MSDRRAYHATLPRKRMGAGALFLNENGRILLVQPAYKPVWEIPGGVVEENESPRACCRREVREELGLDRPVGRLLLVDYNHTTAEKTESLMFIFAGGVLTPADSAAIQLPAAELLNHAFFAAAELPPAMSDSLRARTLAAYRQLEIAGAVYLEDQGTGPWR